HFYNIDLEPLQKEPVEITWDAASAEKGGYAHFMIKEIHEQPKAVQDTISVYLKDKEEGKAISFAEAGLTDEFLAGLERIYIVACGSAYHVGVAGKYVIESLSGIPVETDLASEFRYRNPRLMENSLVIIVSQSGETADSLAALRLAKERGVPVLSIVNVLGSSIARESDYVLYTYAGPEISVATTKAYSAQLAVVYLLAVQCAMVQGAIGEERYEELAGELLALPDKIEKALENKERIQWFASKYANAKDIFFIGRGLDYAIGMEGSLKMKEISYIHSEAYAAGELKHGTISLIEEGTLVVGILTQPELYEKTISNMVETKSRGAYLMGLTSYGNYGVEDTVNFAAYVAKTDPLFAASVVVVPLQLLGYYLSASRGLDVDKPRNLAKSVTVE
ncbi:MAG TPA: glutamine--fructose-6-phosphate transaminase (isomerizing), partial [Candidatus Copromonas faecavium]|nr:glutamine--fructose-6-phosphate transaminase (isomerizing) [Candidatus Copromonas faecavium]